MNVYICMPELRLKTARFNREIYVVSFASDLRGESNHRSPAVGAANRILMSFAPEIEAAMSLFVVAASNIFHNIDKERPPQLGGDGIVLYPPADPQGMLALHVSIVESDQGTRRQGDLLEEIFARQEVSDALGAISKATGAAGPIPAEILMRAMGAITSAIPAILKKQGDDPILDYGFSGREIAHYHGTIEGRRHAFENKKVAAGITVYTA